MWMRALLYSGMPNLKLEVRTIVNGGGKKLRRRFCILQNNFRFKTEITKCS